MTTRSCADHSKTARQLDAAFRYTAGCVVASGRASAPGRLAAGRSAARTSELSLRPFLRVGMTQPHSASRMSDSFLPGKSRVLRH